MPSSRVGNLEDLWGTITLYNPHILPLVPQDTEQVGISEA